MRQRKESCMPELPEVETVVRTLAPRLAGRRITRLVHLRPDVLQPAGADLAALVTGQSVQRIQRRGKRILIRLETNATLYIHLGMTGQLTIEPPDAPLKPHTHLVLDLSDNAGQLRFRDPRRFGGVWHLPAGDAGDQGIGPEPLAMRASQLARGLSRTSRSIKLALLDQALVAGIGNIYADESLHLAGVHPLTPSNQLSDEQTKALCRSIKRILRRAIRHRGSSLRDYVDADGLAGGFQRLHRVYDRAGEPCRTCDRPIERIVLGGRSTHFCPRCQPAPRLKARAG
jgi:formamidopyrimidine-DNA glycosylase